MKHVLPFLALLLAMPAAAQAPDTLNRVVPMPVVEVSTARMEIGRAHV